MDIASPPPPPPPAPATATATTTAGVKSLEGETQTLNRIQLNTVPKQLPPPFSNGVLKRHKPRQHHNPPPVVVTYGECLKNHAATIGCHAVDGCGEFMPSPASTTADPTSLKCAACGCHRNFHRRYPDESFPNNPPAQHVVEYQPHHRHHPPPPIHRSSPPDSPSPPPISSSYYPSAPHMLLALSAGVSAPPPENNNNHNINNNNSNPFIPITPGSGSGAGNGSNPNGKKRFRTKFTQDQKEKMHELAERVEWKMQKRDEDLINGFCNEIGVDRGVFKVWMHNNKIAFNSKKDSSNHNNDNGSYGGGIDFLSAGNHNHREDEAGNHRHNNDSISSGGNVIGTNGSSSSS